MGVEVLSWEILVNTDGHFKFWSYNLRTGEVYWGRIGAARPQSGRYDSDVILRRRNNKLASGYRVFAQGVDYYVPSEEQVLNGGPVITQETERERRIHRAATEAAREAEAQAQTPRERHQQRTSAINVPAYDKTYDVPNVESYKTDTQGYIKNYRSDYKRPAFDVFKAVMVNQIIAQNGRILDRTYYNIAKAYYQRIPANSQFNKPAEFKMLRDRSLPTFVVVFLNNKCVAIWGHHRARGECSFFSIKSDVPQRTTLLKKILFNMANTNSSQDGKLKFKIKSEAMEEKIKEVAPYFTQGDGFFTYKVVDLRSGFSTLLERPVRWIDD
jgi:hypothetical protein